MTRHDDGLCLIHMRDAAQRVVERTYSLSREQFDANEDLRLACVHLIQVLGEAARGVSDQTKQANPHIPWHQITGMRHRIVHEYFAVDEDVVWDVAKTQLPALLPELARLAPDDH